MATDRPQHPVVSGALATMIETLVGYPLEFMKTQLQLLEAPSAAAIGGSTKPVMSASASPRAYSTWTELLRYTYSNHGLRGFYRGLPPGLLFAFPRGMVRFFTYEGIIEVLGASQQSGNGTAPQPMTAYATFFAGLLAGAAEAATCQVPMNTLQVKFCHDLSLAQPRYTSLLRGITLIVQEQGWAGVYQGFAPTLVKVALNHAIRFTLYEHCCHWLLGLGEGASSRRLSAWETLLAGGFAGAVSVVANHPVDVVKSNMQGLCGPLYRNTWHCARVVLASHGIKGLYRGLMPRIARVTVEMSVVFTCYDQISHVVDAWW